MTVEIRHARDRFGSTFLIVDGDLTSVRSFAFFNVLTHVYLQPSVNKAVWGPAPFYFELPVHQSNGRASILVGPEITAFIPDEMTVELVLGPNGRRETLLWHGLLMNITWPPDAATTEAGAEQAGIESRHLAELVRLEDERRARAAEERVRLEHVKGKKL